MSEVDELLNSSHSLLVDGQSHSFQQLQAV